MKWFFENVDTVCNQYSVTCRQFEFVLFFQLLESRCSNVVLQSEVRRTQVLDSLSGSLKTGQIRFEDKSVYSHNLPRHLHCRTDYELRRRIPTWLKLRFLWYVRLASGKWQTGTAQASFPANTATTNRDIDFNVYYTCLSWKWSAFLIWLKPVNISTWVTWIKFIFVGVLTPKAVGRWL